MTQQAISDLVIVSDLHIYDWPQHNEKLRRTIALLSWFKSLVLKAHSEGKKVLMCGDLLHNPQSMSQELASVFFPVMDYLNKKVNPSTVLAITGNHDRNGDNPKESKSWVKTLSLQYPFLHCIDFQSYQVNKSLVVCGIPYLKGNVGLADAAKTLLKISNDQYPGAAKVLAIHTDLPGAIDTNGVELKSYENIPQRVSEFFNGWAYVFSGHIHAPMKVRDNIIMVGSPMHTRVSDHGCKMGHWQYTKNGLEMIESHLPEYRYEGEQGMDYDVYIKNVVKKAKATKEEAHRDISLSNWDKTLDEYFKAGPKVSSKTRALVKDIINSVNV